jgi:hypothetical protein
MASPPIPPALGHLSGRPFSFYPPINSFPHNEWIFRKATWSELIVVNAKSGEEVSIARHFIGDISRTGAPVIIVGLTRELEYRDGAVWPARRRVVEMPIAVGSQNAPAPHPRPAEAAPVVAIRLEPRNGHRALKAVGGALAAAIVLHVTAVSIVRVGEVRHRTPAVARDRSYLDLTGRDRYEDVVRKLGAPASDRQRSEAAAIQYWALEYPRRRFTVILMGSDPASAAYVGTMDDNWQPVHAVTLDSGGTTAPLLRALQRF